MARGWLCFAVCLTLLLPPLAWGDNSPLDDHVKWCIFHEGCRVFFVAAKHNQLDDEMRPISELRNCFLAVQRHNPEAYELIRSATDTQLKQAIDHAIQVIPTEFSLQENFKWVAFHEGQYPAFHRLDLSAEYEGIRAIYASKQAHNPNARNLLAAVQNTFIHNLVGVLGKDYQAPVNSNFVADRWDDRVAIVDPTRLSPAVSGSIQSAILSSAAWKPTIVVKEQLLGDFITDKYGTTDQATILAIAEAISKRNRITPPSTPITAEQIAVREGQTLQVPALPVVPRESVSSKIFQAIDPLKHHVTVQSYDPRGTQALAEDYFQKSSAWVLSVPPASLKSLLSRLGAAGQREFKKVSYLGPTFETTNLILTGTECSGSKMPHARTGPSASISPLVSTSDKLYVLDFFDSATAGKCPHGQKVLEVIRQTLSVNGAENLFASNVIPIELDFFRHQPQLTQYLDEYINAQDTKVRPSLRAFVAELKKRDPKTVDQWETPVIYLQAVYSHVLKDPTASVVSSEFYGETSSFSLLPPPPLFAPTSRVALVTAASDTALDVESFPLEPIRTYYTIRRDYGALIIGGIRRDGSTFGMTSSAGDGIACFGYGDGWGGDGTCIVPNEFGTSFSTPAVATTMYLTRIGLTGAASSSGTYLKSRLLHGVPIMSGLKSQCVAAGVPDDAWLRTTSGLILIDSQNKPIEVTAMSGSLKFAHPGAGDEHETTFGLGPNAASGFQHTTNGDYIFDNTAGRWDSVVISSGTFQVSYQDGTNKTFSDLQSFYLSYKGAVKL